VASSRSGEVLLQHAVKRVFEDCDGRKAAPRQVKPTLSINVIAQVRFAWLQHPEPIE
jgi:hypothetical protein